MNTPQTATDPLQPRRGVDPALAIILILFGALYAVFIGLNTFIYEGRLIGTLFDDALISLRYGQNFAQGHGLVWNPGEDPPVEGYTNPLWTLLMAGLSLVFDTNTAPIAVSVLSALILLGSGSVAYLIAQRCGGERLICCLAAVLVLSCYALVFWSLRGMEAGLVGLLILAAVLFALPRGEAGPSQRNLILIWFIAGLSFLVRMDSIICFAPVLIWFGLSEPRRLLLSAWPLVAIVAAQMLFRVSYYHEFLPNTYALKMTGVPWLDRAVHGVGAFLNASPAPLAGLLLLALIDRKKKTNEAIIAALAAGAMAIEIAYFIWIGGDAWRIDNSNRFFASIFPLLMTAVAINLPVLVKMLSGLIPSLWLKGLVLALVVLSLAASPVLWPKVHWNLVFLAGIALFGVALIFALENRKETSGARVFATLLAAAGFAVFCSGPAWVRWGLGGAFEAPEDEAFARQGLWLKKVLPANATIAAAWLGAPAYHSGLKAFDIYGKVDKIVARSKPTFEFRPGHNKIDTQHTVGDLRPDLVLYSFGDLNEYGYVRLNNELWARADFLAAFPDARMLNQSWCPSADLTTYCPQR